MTEVERIADQMKRAAEGDAWHGSSLTELLAGTGARQAAWRPIADAHTIWELVLHITTWRGVAERRLQGGPPVALSDDEDWPTVGDTSEAAWQAALEALALSGVALRRAVLKLKDARLGDMLPGSTTTCYVLLHGVVQHDLYHAGQIGLLRKATPRVAARPAAKPAPKPVSRPKPKPKVGAGRRPKRPGGNG